MLAFVDSKTKVYHAGKLAVSVLIAILFFVEFVTLLVLAYFVSKLVDFAADFISTVIVAFSVTCSGAGQVGCDGEGSSSGGEDGEAVDLHR